MNEKQVKEAAAKRRAVCSITGGPCECVDGGGCRNREPLLDRAPDDVLLAVRTSKILLYAAFEWLVEAEDAAGGFSRRYPVPEVRQWRREIDKIMCHIEEVLGE
jgi:hypothetical protein